MSVQPLDEKNKLTKALTSTTHGGDWPRTSTSLGPGSGAYHLDYNLFEPYLSLDNDLFWAGAQALLSFPVQLVT